MEATLLNTDYTNPLSSYIILRLSLPPTTTSIIVAKKTSSKTAASRTIHYLYLRPDAPSIPTPDTPRSVFVSNVPVDASEASIRTLFKQVGGALVERAVFEGGIDDAQKESQPIMLVKGQQWGGVSGNKNKMKKRKRDGAAEGEDADAEGLPSTWDNRPKKSGGSAVIVFVDKATAEAVIKECKSMARKQEAVEWKTAEEWGEKRYRNHQTLSFPSRSTLQANINAYLSHYTLHEAARTARLKQLRSEPDADGFISVVRGGRHAPARAEEAQAAQERQKERTKKRVGTVFYRFQGREERKKREVDMRKKVEQDIDKIQVMRRTKSAAVPET